MVKIPNSQMNKALAYLIAAFPDCPEFTELNYQVYYDVLSDYSYDDILAGARRFVKGSGSKFFPSAPQLVRWVDPKTTADDIFDAAMEGQIEHEAKRDKLLGAFLEKKIQEGKWFVRVRMHEDSPFRDTWDWLGEDERHEGKYKHTLQKSALALKAGLPIANTPIRMALTNSMRMWFLELNEGPAPLDRGNSAN